MFYHALSPLCNIKVLVRNEPDWNRTCNIKIDAHKLCNCKVSLICEVLCFSELIYKKLSKTCNFKISCCLHLYFAL